MDISRWANSAGGNTALSPNGFSEGMAPSGVNDAAREVMAAVRRERESAEWFDWGYTPTYATTSTFTLVGDRTSIFHVGRRVRCGDASTLYGTITDTTYSSATRVSVSFPSGQLSSSLSSVAVGILSFSAHSMPIGIFAELSATNTFTAPAIFGGIMSVSGTASFTSRAVFNNGIDVSATANLVGRVLAGGGFASSATASFTSKAVFNSGMDVSDTANFVNRILAGGGLDCSATATFTSKVVMKSGLDVSATISCSTVFPWNNMATDSQIQHATSVVTTYSTCSATISVGASIPQITDGTEKMTVAITPKAAAHILQVSANGYMSADADVRMVYALFRDAEANALSVGFIGGTINGTPDNAQPFSLYHEVTASSTNATTFRLRVGPGTAATITFNGQAGADLFGGKLISRMVVREVKK